MGCTDSKTLDLSYAELVGEHGLLRSMTLDNELSLRFDKKGGKGKGKKLTK